MKALLTRFSITASPAMGAVSGLKSFPGWPGRSGDDGSVDMCRTCTTGRPARAPRAQQRGGTSLQVRVVAPAPARLVEAELEVDDQEGGRMRLEGEHGATVEARGPTHQNRRCADRRNR